jgi:hypothetical protein
LAFPTEAKASKKAKLILMNIDDPETMNNMKFYGKFHAEIFSLDHSAKKLQLTALL